MSEEEEAIKELMSMSQDELDLVPYDTVKLICQAKAVSVILRCVITEYRLFIM